MDEEDEEEREKAQSEAITACCASDAPLHIVRALTESDAAYYGTTCDTVARLLLQCRAHDMPWPDIDFDEAYAILCWEQFMLIELIVRDTELCVNDGGWGCISPQPDIASAVTLLHRYWAKNASNVNHV